MFRCASCDSSCDGTRTLLSQQLFCLCASSKLTSALLTPGDGGGAYEVQRTHTHTFYANCDSDSCCSSGLNLHIHAAGSTSHGLIHISLAGAPVVLPLLRLPLHFPQLLSAPLVLSSSTLKEEIFLRLNVLLQSLSSTAMMCANVLSQIHIFWSETLRKPDSSCWFAEMKPQWQTHWFYIRFWN